jgi:hypothetical protein
MRTSPSGELTGKGRSLLEVLKKESQLKISLKIDEANATRKSCFGQRIAQIAESSALYHSSNIYGSIRRQRGNEIWANHPDLRFRRIGPI